MFAKTLESTSAFNQPLSTNQNLILELKELEAVLAKLGLYLSAAELNQLCSGKFVSLEHLTLAEIGTILILANAIASAHFKQKQTCFHDLLLLKGSLNSFGIPLYCWQNNRSLKHYLRLAFLEGVPVIVIS